MKNGWHKLMNGVIIALVNADIDSLSAFRL